MKAKFLTMVGICWWVTALTPVMAIPAAWSYCGDAVCDTRGCIPGGPEEEGDGCNEDALNCMEDCDPECWANYEGGYCGDGICTICAEVELFTCQSDCESASGTTPCSPGCSSPNDCGSGQVCNTQRCCVTETSPVPPEEPVCGGECETDAECCAPDVCYGSTTQLPGKCAPPKDNTCPNSPSCSSPNDCMFPYSYCSPSLNRCVCQFGTDTDCPDKSQTLSCPSPTCPIED